MMRSALLSASCSRPMLQRMSRCTCAAQSSGVSTSSGVLPTSNYVKVMTCFDRQRKGTRSAPIRRVEEDGYAVDGEDEADDNNFVYPALDGLDVKTRLRAQAAVQEAASNYDPVVVVSQQADRHELFLSEAAQT